MNRQLHRLPKPGVDPALISTQPKDAPSYFCPRIVFLILLIASIALKCTVIVLMFSGSQVPSAGIKARRGIQSCLQKCIPCGSAEGHITANLTLNPSTAHPQLYVSSDLKSVGWKGMSQQVNSTPLRYDVMASVLSHESFNSGKLCWEVEVVEEGEWWGVGIVRESANRNGVILLEPRGGYWGVQRINGKHQSITEPRTDLTLCHSPRRIRVSLDYVEGLVAFFDGDTNAEIFTFPKANFAGEKMHAWFLIFKWKGQLLLHP
ncbi:butyrophilin subfamily 1 member A1-like isoform X1 [Pantherophis guttatus]|uniref:Butyrophilin subfamily 1 member A1-like isoform X1 n=2 Tax=Pantherophis guttatus TaxID=94885 RepID=A0A6P9C2G6_PANGU|nr:butyrophilin subfamily 1 member A1-like isoform X1 [Pantherophis guttatus]